MFNSLIRRKQNKRPLGDDNIAFESTTFSLTTAVNPINSPHIWGADFVFRCTTGGTLSLQWASEVNASAAQLNVGSVMMVEEIETT